MIKFEKQVRMILSEEVKNYQRILKGVDAMGKRISIAENRLKVIEQDLFNDEINSQEIDLLAVVRSSLNKVYFFECSIEDSLFFENTFIDVGFSFCSLYDSQIRDSNFENVTYDNCNLGKTQFSEIKFINSTFENCNLNWSSLRDVIFENCILLNIDFTGVTLNNVQFINCKLSNCKSTGEYRIKLIEHEGARIIESDDLLDLIDSK